MIITGLFSHGSFEQKTSTLAIQDSILNSDHHFKSRLCGNGLYTRRECQFTLQKKEKQRKKIYIYIYIYTHIYIYIYIYIYIRKKKKKNFQTKALAFNFLIELEEVNHSSGFQCTL